MSIQALNPKILSEIAIETRQCFLHEDAPVYLANLQKGIAQIQSGKPADYVFLMHAAHSLKGGSAIAELSSLSKLAHKLEDMLEILQEHEFGDRATIAEILSDGVDEIAAVLAQANGLPLNSLSDIAIDQELLDRLDALFAIAADQRQESLHNPEGVLDGSSYGNTGKAEDLSSKHRLVIDNRSMPILDQQLARTLTGDSWQKNKSGVGSISPMVISSLEKDLESCIKQVETSLLADGSLSEPLARKELECFCEECLLLGDTLSLDWLIKIVEPFEAYLQQQPAIADLLLEVEVVIKNLRSQRQQYLYPELEAPEKSLESLVEKAIVKPQSETEAPIINDIATETISYLRVPSIQIENMTNIVAEMILRHERLVRQHQQLGQTNKNLQALVLQIVPLQEQVQNLYDQLAIAAPNNSLQNSSSLNQDEPRLEYSRNHLAQISSIDDDFDKLELDQYSSAHSTLQSLQEVLLRVRESRSDIDLNYQDLGEEIKYLRQDLDRVYAQLTQSRLVPFKTLANRFSPQLKRLCQRYAKQVELVVQGEDILIDQVVLDQLQTPLNHLLINAFDHGVETPDIRSALGKPTVAVLTLSAAISGNQVVISLQDDGDGINLYSVYKKAVEKNICPPEVPISKIPRQEILNFIFQPHFSTRSIVSDISGRGMGLDIVRSQVNRLRGNIQVETLQGQGTTFTIRLPLGLSLVTLLICDIGGHLMAIPASDVLDILPYAQAPISQASNSTLLAWRKKNIPLIHIRKVLAPWYQDSEPLNPKVCLVLNRNDLPIAIAIDALIEERQLILKPFDRTVLTPNYLAGCTILGTGQVVPVLVPDNLNTLIQESKVKRNAKANTKANTKSNQSASQSNKNARIESEIAPSKTILVVEDSIATRNMLERVLKQLDFEVVPCRDGQEAIDVLNRTQGKIEMVISDVEMPRMNGFDLLQAIRTHDLWYGIPVVMLTSRTGDRHRQKAISLGANGYLSKPIIVGELIACLGELV